MVSSLQVSLHCLQWSGGGGLQFRHILFLLIIMVPMGRLDRMKKERKGNDESLEGTEATIYDLPSWDWLAGVGSPSV